MRAWQVVLLGIASVAPATPARPQDGVRVDGFDAARSAWGTLTAALAQAWAVVEDITQDPSAPPGPTTTVVATHRTCADADGLPTDDCSVAAGVTCRERGFAVGTQVEVQTGRVCRVTSQGWTQVAHAVTCKRKAWLVRVACE